MSTRWWRSFGPRRLSVEERASSADEIASIEGLDEATAGSSQARARDYLEKIEAGRRGAQEARRSDDIKEVPGITPR
jgi:hypothetical protein